MRQKINPSIIIIALLSLFTLAFAGSTYYFYGQFRQLKMSPQQIQNKTAPDEIKALIDKVGALMVLPTGEEPVVATVTDPEKLKQQVFFTQAKKGDKVLIYSKAQKAILYDPVANKIIEVAPLSFGNPAVVKP